MVTTTLHSIKDLMDLNPLDQDYELIDGELISMAPISFHHGEVQVNIGAILRFHVRQQKLGRVTSDAGFILSRNPDTVLAPDVAFVTADRFRENPTGFAELAPDLAVEVISTSNNPGEVERKLAIYLKSGVRMIWIVYPLEKEVVIHAPTGPPRVFTNQDRIDGGDVLPGLDLSVEDIFA